MALRRKPDEDGQLRLLEVDASMAGTLSFKDPVNLQINGQFEGSLDVRGVLTVGPSGRVRATIHGEQIVIAGRVEGPVTASKRMELMATARVLGKVTTPRLVMHEGAVLQGPCEMIAEPAASEGPPSQWMSLEELARYLEVDAAAILDWAQNGKLTGRQEGGQWRFERQLVEAWLAQEKIR